VSLHDRLFFNVLLLLCATVFAVTVALVVSFVTIVLPLFCGNGRLCVRIGNSLTVRCSGWCATVEEVARQLTSSTVHISLHKNGYGGTHRTIVRQVYLGVNRLMFAVTNLACRTFSMRVV